MKILMQTLCFVSLFFIQMSLLYAQESSFSSFDGTKIHYEISGKGKPVVLIHGYIGNSQMWKNGNLIKELAKADYQVITLDLRGNGLSDRPQELEAYLNDAELKDIMALIKYLKIKRYDVVGYSRGAILTARLLVLDKNIQKAVLGGMGADFTNPNWDRPKMFEELFSGKADKHPQLKSALEYAKSIKADTMVLSYLQIGQPKVSPQELSKIKKSVLVIAGDMDKDNGDPVELAKLLKNSTLKTVPGNHNNTARSLPFAEAVVEFLKKEKNK